MADTLKLVKKISRLAKGKKHLRLMEVCGTHTVAIFRSGIRQILPENVELVSGPGCPVCVTDLNFALVNRLHCKTRVNQNEIADLRFGQEHQTCLACDARSLDRRQIAFNRQNFCRKCQTHFYHLAQIIHHMPAHCKIVAAFICAQKK